MVHMKTPSKPYMSKIQMEFNHLYKELDDLYHEAALNTSLSDSAFDILYGFFMLGDGSSGISARPHAFQSRPSTPPSESWRMKDGSNWFPEKAGACRSFSRMRDSM